MLTTDITALDHPPALYSPVSTASSSGAAPSFPSLRWHTATGSKTSAISLSGIYADASETQPAPRIVVAGLYGPWVGTVTNVKWWDDASAAEGERYIQAESTYLSPSNLTISTNYNLFLNSDRLIAHRGLVDLANGIPENTIEAVQNAFNHHINLVEIDVQATSDGVAVPLHDLSLMRPFAINANVNNASLSSIKGITIGIKSPVDRLGYATESGRWYNTGTTLQTLQDLMTQALKSNPSATIFLDPKNLQAAEATARVIMNNRTFADHAVMKTYTPYWGTGAYTSVFGQAHSNFQRETLHRLKIMPVVNLTAYSGGMASAGATAVVVNDVAGWGKRFCVPAVELPGYWDHNWSTLKSNVDAQMRGSILRYNPYDYSNRHVYKPVISTGYRFEDFSLDGVPFDWGMDGNGKADHANAIRRTVGAERFSSGWITTDNPLQEAYAMKHNVTFPQPGNPHQAITTTEVPSWGEGDNGDQGGP